MAAYIISVPIIVQGHSTEILLSTAQKIKFSIEDFFSKCDQIRSFLFRGRVARCSKKWRLKTFSQGNTFHCVKIVRIWSYFGPHFPAFGLNTERYSASLCIQFKCGKMRTRITPNMDTFYTVFFSDLQ